MPSSVFFLRFSIPPSFFHIKHPNSLMLNNSWYFKKYIYSEQERKRERTSHLLVYSPCACNSWNGAQQKIQGRQCNIVFMWVARTELLGPLSLLPRLHVSRKLEAGLGIIVKSRYSDEGHSHLTWGVSYSAVSILIWLENFK